MKPIDFIQPQSRTLPIDQLTFTIEPVRMGMLPGLLRAIEPMLSELYILAEANALSPDRILGLAASFGDEMNQAVAIMARAERSVIDALLPDQFMALAALCIEVNQDFFKKALPSIMAQLPALAPSLQKALAQAGKGVLSGAVPQTNPTPEASTQPATPVTGLQPSTS